MSSLADFFFIAGLANDYDFSSKQGPKSNDNELVVNRESRGDQTHSQLQQWHRISTDHSISAQGDTTTVRENPRERSSLSETGVGTPEKLKQGFHPSEVGTTSHAGEVIPPREDGREEVTNRLDKSLSFTPMSVRPGNTLFRKVSNPSMLKLARRLSLRIPLMDNSPDQPLSRPRSHAYAHYSPQLEPLVFSPGTHPLKEKFPPNLLDKYPRNHEIMFPEYVPMFAFPDDITIRLSDVRPPSTWHGFSLSRDNGDILSGLCTILWVPLASEAAQGIEARCEHWRHNHMSLEEREMSLSLASRLAKERASLSALLLDLSTSNPAQRDEIHEMITLCEERITLYTELLRPVRHGAVANIEGLTQGAGMWMPRAFGVLGTDSSQQMTWKAWLDGICASYIDTELLNVPHWDSGSAPFLPLERYVTNMCQHLPDFTPRDFVIDLQFRSSCIKTTRTAPNELPGSQSTDLFPLFRALSLENVVSIFEAALLECRIIFVSSNLSMLSSAASALTNILFPFKWRGIYIPILPKRLFSYLDAPIPFIMGIHRLHEENVLPRGEDVVICDLDRNTVEAESVIKLPMTVRKKLLQLLGHVSPMHNKYSVPYGPPAYCEETYPMGNVVRVDCQNSSPFSVEDLVTSSASKLVRLDASRIRKPEMNVLSRHGHPTFSLQADTVWDAGCLLTDPAPQSRLSSFPQDTSSAVNMQKKYHALRSPGLRSNTSIHTSRIRPFCARHASSSSISSGYLDPSLYESTHLRTTVAASTIIDLDRLSIIRSAPELSESFTLEGHDMMRVEMSSDQLFTSACDVSVADIIHGDYYRCRNCALTICERHRVVGIAMPCLPKVFDSLKVRISFVRCLATLLSNYQKHLVPVVTKGIVSGKVFDRAAYIRSLDSNYFMKRVVETQAFAGFIDERLAPETATNPEVLLFERIMMARRNRFKSGLFRKAHSSYQYCEPINAATTVKLSIPKSEDLESYFQSERPEIPDRLDERWLS